MDINGTASTDAWEHAQERNIQNHIIPYENWFLQDRKHFQNKLSFGGGGALPPLPFCGELVEVLGVVGVLGVWSSLQGVLASLVVFRGSSSNRSSSTENPEARRARPEVPRSCARATSPALRSSGAHAWSGSQRAQYPFMKEYT